jgi:hypothetical protein
MEFLTQSNVKAAHHHKALGSVPRQPYSGQKLLSAYKNMWGRSWEDYMIDSRSCHFVSENGYYNWYLCFSLHLSIIVSQVLHHKCHSGSPGIDPRPYAVQQMAYKTTLQYNNRNVQYEGESVNRSQMEVKQLYQT